MGLHLTIHSNFELGLQSRFRGDDDSALGYYPRRAGLYLGTTPRLCLAMDTEYNHVRDDVLVGGKLPIKGGFLPLGSDPGHGLKLDPERLGRFASPESGSGRIAPIRRPFTTTTASTGRGAGRCQAGTRIRASSGSRGRPIPMTSQGFLGIDRRQDVDVELDT